MHCRFVSESSGFAILNYPSVLGGIEHLYTSRVLQPPPASRMRKQNENIFELVAGGLYVTEGTVVSEKDVNNDVSAGQSFVCSMDGGGNNRVSARACTSNLQNRR